MLERVEFRPDDPFVHPLLTHAPLQLPVGLFVQRARDHVDRRVGRQAVHVDLLVHRPPVAVQKVEPL